MIELNFIRVYFTWDVIEFDFTRGSLLAELHYSHLGVEVKAFIHILN